MGGKTRGWREGGERRGGEGIEDRRREGMSGERDETRVKVWKGIQVV